jgi:dihydrophenazinedicarboxylate synthase
MPREPDVSTSSEFETLTGEIDLDFPEYGVPPAAPMPLVRRWINEAIERGVREPRALALATADVHGRASNRIVAIIKEIEGGFVFASHSSSQKGRELAATGWASGLLYWRETGQQIIVSGQTALLSDDESDTLWYARPTPLHAMSAVSRQSEPLDDLAALSAEARRLAATRMPLPRPKRFVGYLLQPDTVEFWCPSSDRLHRRLRYDRSPDGWRISRLQP